MRTPLIAVVTASKVLLGTTLAAGFRNRHIVESLRWCREGFLIPSL